MDAREIPQEPRRFYDGGTLPRDGRPGRPPDPGAEARIVLERHAAPELFSLEWRLAYLDRHLGEILVPADRSFRTDLTSVPALFTWLVPRTGDHLPAALVHDALVSDGREEPLSYVVAEGRHVDRVEADRVFRDAMADLGTGVIRRWIVWTAVSVATVFVGRHVPWSPARQWALRAVAALTVAVIVLLGAAATLDLVDRPVPLVGTLPWMGEQGWLAELVGGFAGAVVVPLALSLLWGLLWGPLRMAGAIAGVVLAVLLHVTVGLALISLVYLALERLARRSSVLAWTLAATVVVGSLVVFGWTSAP